MKQFAYDNEKTAPLESWSTVNKSQLPIFSSVALKCMEWTTRLYQLDSLN